MPTLWKQDFARNELLRRVGRLDQIAGVRLVTLADGTERGIRVLEFRTGSGFSFEVLVDRAFDIGHCDFAGRALSWQSNAGFGGPWYAQPDGAAWLRNFGGGLLTTCGLDHILGPDVDTVEYPYTPGARTEQYGLHGRLSNLPARLVGYGERWEGDECVLWAEGEVLQASSFGENLLLRRLIETRVGTSHLTIHDQVSNLGFSPTPHMFLYHVNLGFPVVDSSSELLVPAAQVQPAGDYGSADLSRLAAPQPRTEQVFVYRPLAETSGIVPVGIVNRAMGFGAYQLFRREQFPYALVWKMLGEGSYVVGLEPSTNGLGGRKEARTRGEMIMLQAGEQRNYDLELGVLGDQEQIERFTERVQALVK